MIYDNASKPIPTGIANGGCVGMKERLPPSRFSGCCRFSQGTFAGEHGNGRDAPTAVTYPNRGKPSLATHFGRLPSAEDEY